MRQFKEPGPKNTKETIDLALAFALENKIDRIVIASNTGQTALLLLEACERLSLDLKIICVTHVCEFIKGIANEMSDSTRQSLREKGCQVLTAGHALSGAERSFSSQFGGIAPVQVAAETLRLFGQGVKVAVEISLMAADAGLLATARPVIAIGGTASGADCALALTPETSARFLGTKIHTIICKPDLFE